MKKIPITEIEYIDYPSNHLEEEESFLAETNRLYPWLKWLLGVVVIISVLHFVLF